MDADTKTPTIGRILTILYLITESVGFLGAVVLVWLQTIAKNSFEFGYVSKRRVVGFEHLPRVCTCVVELCQVSTAGLGEKGLFVISYQGQIVEFHEYVGLI